MGCRKVWYRGQEAPCTSIGRRGAKEGLSLGKDSLSLGPVWCRPEVSLVWLYRDCEERSQLGKGPIRLRKAQVPWTFPWAVKTTLGVRMVVVPAT